MSRAGSNILFDEVLASACKEDRQSMCSDVQPVSCDLIFCNLVTHPDLSLRQHQTAVIGSAIWTALVCECAVGCWV